MPATFSDCAPLWCCEASTSGLAALLAQSESTVEVHLAGFGGIPAATPSKSSHRAQPDGPPAAPLPAVPAPAAPAELPPAEPVLPPLLAPALPAPALPAPALPAPALPAPALPPRPCVRRSPRLAGATRAATGRARRIRSASGRRSAARVVRGAAAVGAASSERNHSTKSQGSQSEAVHGASNGNNSRLPAPPGSAVRLPSSQSSPDCLMPSLQRGRLAAGSPGPERASSRRQSRPRPAPERAGHRDTE